MNANQHPSVDTADYWQRRYERGETGWDIGRAEDALLDLHHSGELPAGRMLVPGCGYGWEVTAFARLGFDVTGLDFAAAPLAAIRERAEAEGVAPTLVPADLFALPATWDGQFDVILERACFCAIDPARRDEYVAVVHRLLKPGGKLVGLFYVPEREQPGPPFPASEAELRQRFAGRFTDIRFTPIDHLFSRLGVLIKAAE